MPTCPTCGAEVDPTAKFCTACGQSMDDVGAAGDQPPESQGPDRVDVPGDPFTLDVFEFSFKYPLANGLKAIGMSLVFMLLGILIVPYFMFIGYVYRVGRSAALGKAAPPEIGDYWGLLVDGVRYVVAIGVVMIPAMAAYIYFILTEQLLLANLVYFPMLLVVSAIIPIFYGTGSVRGVYSKGRFLRFLTTTNFWIGLGYQLGITIVLYIAVLLLSIVFLILSLLLIGIPLLIGLFLLFPVYFALLQAALWGRIYHDAAESGAVDGPHNIESVESRW